MLKRTRLSLAVGAVFSAGFAGFVPQVSAQQTMDRVEVTGSLVRRVESEAALPVTVLRTDDLAKVGVTNAEQAVQFIAQNQSGISSSSGVGSSIGGGAFADLRGLGVSRTLVLVNGRRMVNNPYNDFAVDLNTIPLVAVDRIEVLTDGASAIYGTDAISGVINFIMRREYQGFAISADATLPQESGGGEVYTVSGGGGFGSLASDGWNVYGGLTYRKGEPLAATDREFAKSAIIPEKGVFKASPTTFPANYTQGSTVAGNPTLTNCDPPFSLYLPDVFGPNACGFDYVPFINIIPEQEQLSAVLKGSVAIGKDATVFGEVLWTKNTLDVVLSPTPLGGLSMPSTNPFYPGGAAGTPINPASPAPNPANPISLGWRTTLVGGRASSFENITDRYTIGVEGTAFNWNYTAAIFQSNSTVTNTFTGGYLNNSGIRNGLAGLNGAPFLNPFGPQSAAGTAYVQSQLILGEIQEAKGELLGVVAQASGEIFQLPAGAVSLGLGAEYYSSENEYTNNFALIRQAASSGLAGAEDITGDRDNWAINAELLVPVIKNLDLTFAIRYDDYSDFGTTTNPKAAFRWQPTSELLLRGSYATGFRAPTLQDVYAPNSLTFTGNRYNDPVLCPGGVANTAAGGVATRDCNIQFQQQQGGNKELQPEESDSWTIGFVLQPTAQWSFGVDYWSYTITDSIGVLGENEIFENPAQYSNLFVRCSQATASERALIDACGIPGGDPLAYVQNTQLNLGDFESTGFDFSILWNGVATEYGRFSAGYRGTYVTKYEYQIVPNGEFNDNLGNYFNGAAVFRYQHVLNFNWQQGPWSAVLLNRYRSGYDDANAAAGLLDPVYEQNRVGAFSTWDLSFSWAGIKGLTLTAGILNLFDEDPPFTNKGDGFQVGYDERYANPLGRQFLLRAAYEFK
jgi:iron complex outermembrane receptor protein